MFWAGTSVCARWTADPALVLLGFPCIGKLFELDGARFNVVCEKGFEVAVPWACEKALVLLGAWAAGPSWEKSVVASCNSSRALVSL